MRPGIAIVCASLLWLGFAAAAMGQQTEADEFELRGRVINSVTGEPVSAALVQLTTAGNAEFTGADGSFVFSKLPRGRYFAFPTKPGYFSEQEIGRWNGGQNPMIEVPSDAKMVLKLIPEAIIYGELKNEIGEPIDGITVRAQSWQTQGGRRQLQVAGATLTDDEGKFRIAELRPGNYLLAFLPAKQGGWSTTGKLSRGKQVAQGYGTQFYPGVPDASSATGIKLMAGAKFHVTQILSRERVYEIAGVVRGADPAGGINVSVEDAAGETMQRTVRLDTKSGEFQIPGIPTGTYLLTATSFEQNQNGPQGYVMVPSRATLPIHVTSDLSGLVLTLGQGISVGVRVNDDVSAEGTDNAPRVVTVQLISKEFSQLSFGAQVPSGPAEGEQTASRIGDVLPGTYTVEALLNHPGYIASMRSGGTDLLRDELTIAQGAAVAPIEITVRDDGAQLSVTTVENGQPAAAGVVIYSQEYPRRSLVMQSNESGTVSMGGLAPGQYQVFALKEAEDLEFHNSAAMEKYLGHASAVTLHPGEEKSVQVEVEKPEEHEQ